MAMLRGESGGGNKSYPVGSIEWIQKQKKLADQRNLQEMQEKQRQVKPRPTGHLEPEEIPLPSGDTATRNPMDYTPIPRPTRYLEPESLSSEEITLQDPIKPAIQTPNALSQEKTHLWPQIDDIGGLVNKFGEIMKPVWIPPVRTDTHQEIVDISSQYDKKKRKRDWNWFDTLDLWVKRDILKQWPEATHQYKEDWVSAYQDVIEDAAKKFDLPSELVAGVIYNEVGGEPFLTDYASSMRKAIIGEDPDTASYGYPSVQIKTAAETLGYDPDNLTGQERFDIIKTLQDPEMSIYVASKYLSNLRDQQLNDIGADNMTDDDMIVLASQYNRGPSIGLTKTGYGQSAIDNMKRIGSIQ